MATAGLEAAPEKASWERFNCSAGLAGRLTFFFLRPDSQSGNSDLQWHAFESQMNRVQAAKLLISVLILGVVASCAAVGPTPSELADADYGRPLSINYREAIREHMDPLFFYWKTAQYQFTEPYQGWYQDPPELGGETHFCYRVDVLINAKDDTGKYKGYQPYTIYFRDNLLIHELAPENGACQSKRPYAE